MSEWLSAFITLSVAGSGILFFSCLISFISRNTFSSTWHYRSRKLTLFFFLVPVFWISEWASLFKKESQKNMLGSLSIAYENTFSITEQFVQIVFVVWIFGVVLTSLWFLYLYRDFNRKLQKNYVFVSKENVVYEILHKQLKEMEIQSKIEIVLCRINISPILIGVFKPKIVLPMQEIPCDELNMIIRHELIHYKKKDLWIKRVMLLVTILHWYNPFIYVLQREINKWCELSCDEEVVMKMSHAERKKYGETILNMMQRAAQDSRELQNSSKTYLSTSFTNGQINLKRRLMKMLKVKKKNKPIVVLSTLVLLTFGVVGVASSAFAYKNQPLVTEENMVATIELDEPAKESETKGEYHLYSVKLSDESKFKKDEWAKILKQIENGEVVLED